MKLYIAAFILLFFSGCASYNEFAKRKYLKGYFSDKAERYVPVGFKTRTGEKPVLLTDASTPLLMANDAVCASENAARSAPSFNLKKNIIQPVPVKQKEIIRSKMIPLPEDDGPKDDPEETSRRALLLAIVGLLFLLSLYGALAGVIFMAIALTRAKKVLNNSLATEKQLKRARTAKTMAIISLYVYFAAALIALIWALTAPYGAASG